MSVWNDALKVGDDHIDNHHREMFHLTSLLDEALQTQSIDKIEAIISFLEHYVVAHFEEEEALMRDHQYAYYVHHKSEHEVFKAYVGELRNVFESGISKTHLIFKIRQLLDKLAIHIRTVDIGIAGIVNS